MKRQIAICLLCVSLCTSAYAHPGRTDSKGGHRNTSTGEYHYHHGKPEHQHINGVCPYDKTAGKSDFDFLVEFVGAESKNNTSKGTKSSDNIQPQKESSSNGYLPILIVVGGALIVFFKPIANFVRKIFRKDDK